MKLSHWLALLLVPALVIGGAVYVTGRAMEQRDAAQKQVTLWQAKYAEASQESRRVVDTVIQVSRISLTKRDTLFKNLTDTVLVKEFIHHTDTLRVACLRCAAMLDTLRVTSDSTIRALKIQVEAVKPSWVEKHWYVPTLGAFAFGVWVAK